MDNGPAVVAVVLDQLPGQSVGAGGPKKPGSNIGRRRPARRRPGGIPITGRIGADTTGTARVPIFGGETQVRFVRQNYLGLLPSARRLSSASSSTCAVLS